MIINYEFLVKIIIVEVIIVLLILVSTLLLRFIGGIKLWRKKKQTEKMVNQLKSMIETNTYKIDNAKSWRQLDLVIPIIYQFDESYPIGAWISIKDRLLREILLPIARSYVKNKKWLYRFFAAECFELKAEPSDESNLTILLNDPVRLVNLYASLAAIKHGSSGLINKVLDQMSQERRLTQTIHLYIFERISHDKVHIIEERLVNEKNIYVRAVCYKLLTTLSYKQHKLDVISDIQSNNLDLKIAALRYLALSDPEQAKKVAVDLLADTTWEVRAISLQILSQLKADDWIKNISVCLRDPVWWVRFNAATTLFNFGEKGKEILLNQDPNIDKFSYETAQFVLRKKG